MPGQDTLGEPVYAGYFGFEGNDWANLTAWSDFPPEYPPDSVYLYVVDLDRDAFSVNHRCHFRLSNLPEDWEDHLELDEEPMHYRFKMPTWLSSEFLAYNVVAPAPVVDQDLLAAYKTYEVTEVDPPTPPASQWLEMEIMLKLVDGLISMVDNIVEHTWPEYDPTDFRMQKIIYALVKCCCWESLSFSPAPLRTGRRDDKRGSNLPTFTKSD